MDAKERHYFYRIRDICQSVANGDYFHLMELKEMATTQGYPPVIAELSSSICAMIEKIHHHEHELEVMVKELQEVRDLLKKKNISLREKVHALEINIDQIKKNKEVAQIAQSAFFKEIKHKASKRRKK